MKLSWISLASFRGQFDSFLETFWTLLGLLFLYIFLYNFCIHARHKLYTIGITIGLKGHLRYYKKAFENIMLCNKFWRKICIYLIRKWHFQTKASKSRYTGNQKWKIWTIYSMSINILPKDNCHPCLYWCTDVFISTVKGCPLNDVYICNKDKDEILFQLVYI